MRRTSKIAALAVVASIALAGCGNNDDNKSSAGGSKGGTEDVCKTAKGDGPKIGLAYDVGGRGDQSFNDSAYLGLAKAVKEFDGSCLEGEAQDGEAESAREDRLRQMADGGANAIVGVGFAYSDAINAVAPDYPKVNFGVVDGFDPDKTANDNVAYFSFSANESSFLVGVAAAKETKSTQHQVLRGRLHRGRQGRRPEHQGRRRLHRGERPLRLQRPGGRQDRGGR